MGTLSDELDLHDGEMYGRADLAAGVQIVAEVTGSATLAAAARSIRATGLPAMNAPPDPAVVAGILEMLAVEYGRRSEEERKPFRAAVRWIRGGFDLGDALLEATDRAFGEPSPTTSAGGDGSAAGEGPASGRGTPQLHCSSSSFPSRFVEDNAKKGYRITAVAHGAGTWMVYLSPGSHRQLFYCDKRFPGPWIRSQWAGSYRTAHLACGSGVWCVVMNAEEPPLPNAGPLTEYFHTAKDFPTVYARTQYARSRLGLSAMAHDGRDWTVVLAPTAVPQEVHSRPEFPATVINRSYRTGPHRIACLVAGDKTWALVTKATGRTQQYLRRPVFPRIEIGRMAAAGFSVARLAYGGGNWIAVMEAETSAEPAPAEPPPAPVAPADDLLAGL